LKRLGAALSPDRRDAGAGKRSSKPK